MRNKPRRFTKEEDKFIRDNAYGLTRAELLKMFNDKFKPITDVQLKNYLNRNRIHLGKFVYDDEQREFIIDYYSKQKHTVRDTVKEFQRLWPDMNMNLSKMGGFLSNNGVRNGMSGRYNETQFKKGMPPHNVFKDGQTSKWGKLNMVKHNGVLKTQARANWEDKYGEIPKGYGVIHIDGNKENDDISNLILIDAKERGKMIQNGLTNDVETNEMIIARVKLESALERKMNEDSKNPVGS